MSDVSEMQPVPSRRRNRRLPLRRGLQPVASFLRGASRPLLYSFGAAVFLVGGVATMRYDRPDVDTGLAQEPGSNPAPAPAAPAAGEATAAARYGWGEPVPEASDEFDYGSEASPAPPDPQKWSLAGGGEGGCGEGHDGNGRRCDKNTRVLGGILRMVGEENGDTGWIGSKFGQQYGRWEARVRSAPTGPGSERQYHPLLILWPDSDSRVDGGEYDYLENGEPGAQCAEAFIHYPHPGTDVVQQEFAQRCGVDLTEWHSFAIEWTPDHVKGFVDGEEWFSYSGGENDVRRCIQCATSMHQTIQLDNFYGDAMQPAVYEVDWVRVYPPTATTGSAPDGDAGSADDSAPDGGSAETTTTTVLPESATTTEATTELPESTTTTESTAELPGSTTDIAATITIEIPGSMIGTESATTEPPESTTTTTVATTTTEPPESTTTTTPATTTTGPPPSTQTTTTTTAPGPTGSPTTVDQDDPEQTGTLPVTGSTTVPLVAAGAALVALGAVALAARRRYLH